MNGFILASLAFAAIANVAEGTWVIGTATAGATTLSAGSATALGLFGGIILLHVGSFRRIL